MPISQNGQTHSNNSSATCNFDYFVGLALKGLTLLMNLLLHVFNMKDSPTRISASPFLLRIFMPYIGVSLHLVMGESTKKRLLLKSQSYLTLNKCLNKC